MAINKPTKETLDNWLKDPTNWKWGIFYHNLEDDRLFVPKKIEWMGTTFNFANKKSYLFLIGMFLFFGLVLFTIYSKNITLP